jgi:thioester reductase-like protein
MGLFDPYTIMSVARSESDGRWGRDGKILVTGGSGVVGQALLTLLKGYPVLALRHKRTIASDVATIAGDLTAPRFGLDETAYRTLLRDVRLIVHCAAVTSVAPPTNHRPVNREGTEEILRCAREASIPTIYVSTAFVESGISQVDEPSGYEASKREAEELVRSAGVPVAIVRPSLVAGDSRSGEISEFQGLHLVLSRVAQNLLPIAPCSPSARVDFVPQDYVGEVIKALIDTEPERWPELVWVTQGDAALTVQGFLEAMQRLSTAVGLAKPTARFIPYERIKRLFEPVFLPALPRPQRRELRALLMFARYLNVEQPFPSLTPDVAGVLGLRPAPAPAMVLQRNFEHWWQHYGSKEVDIAKGNGTV